jgi:hypothetical protein
MHATTYVVAACHGQVKRRNEHEKTVRPALACKSGLGQANVCLSRRHSHYFASRSSTSCGCSGRRVTARTGRGTYLQTPLSRFIANLCRWFHARHYHPSKGIVESGLLAVRLLPWLRSRLWRGSPHSLSHHPNRDRPFGPSTSSSSCSSKLDACCRHARSTSSSTRA